MDWTWGAAEEYDDEGEPSLDFMEYLARRASCSVLPDPPKAMVYPSPSPLLFSFHAKWWAPPLLRPLA